VLGRDSRLTTPRPTPHGDHRGVVPSVSGRWTTRDQVGRRPTSDRPLSSAAGRCPRPRVPPASSSFGRGASAHRSGQMALLLDGLVRGDSTPEGRRL